MKNPFSKVENKGKSVVSKDPSVKDQPLEDKASKGRAAYNCPDCKGEGLVANNTVVCPKCAGTGKV